MHLMRHIVVAWAIVELSVATHVLFHSIIMHSTSVSNLNHRGSCSLRQPKRNATMLTVQYEAYVKDGVGREEQFNVDV
jgi:hypothetical protein